MSTVLHVTSGLGVGGAETVLTQLAVRLQQRGHPQHVASLSARGELADVLESHGVPVKDLTMGAIVKGVSAVMRLRREIRRIEPDVIQGWMYHGNLAAALAHLSVLQSSQRRLFWNLRASNMDFNRYGRAIGWNVRLSGIPDVVIANSNAGLAFHVAQGLRARRTEVVPNGIDTDKFRPDRAARATLRAAYNIGPDDLIVIHVARVDPMKDHSTFLAAMKALPQLRAILVGAGTEHLHLPPNVFAVGRRLDVDRLYPAADVVVSSSAFGEGFSNAIAEGMSAGLVPVATDVGDAALIVDSVGHIVPPGDIGALAAALSTIAELSPDSRRNRGLRARSHIVRNFALPLAVEQYERLYLDR
jgi:glycosyltransferase involved in cell wall biosynthesis